MKITFANLGLIKKTELDLRPMTVIIGQNNTNKTYIAYSVYGLLSIVAGSAGTRVSFIRPLPSSKKRSLHGQMQDQLNWCAARFKESIQEFFQDSSQRLFSETDFAINLDDADKSLNAKSLFAIVPPPFLLPAERNALIITYKLLANRRYKLLKEAQRGIFSRRKLNERDLQILREQGEIRYPQPVEDFLDFLTDVETEPSPSPAKDDPFHALADQIEVKLQNNNRLRMHATVLGGQEIRVRVGKSLDIDLYNASSSIKQLAPLLLYLRHRAEAGQILIIDEPEMNLHPESQARLLEVLAILVNHGVKVLMTTHSPYLLAHINNLIRPTKQPRAARPRQAQALYLKDSRSFLSPDQVSAYEMRDNTLKSLYDPEYGIRWGSLSEVSEDLQRTYFTLPELAKRPPRARKKS